MTVNFFMLCWRRRAVRASAGVVLTLLMVVVASELAVRAFGAISFPLYGADPDVGYWPAPAQSGSFLNKNRWVFNERSMGVAEAFQPGPGRDVLLVGDSIVLGGNPLDQSEKLGPRLTQRTGDRHWPVSAGSWALLNEVHFLKRNMDVVEKTDALVFVFNSEDFGQASSWACDITHPREYPSFALAYLIRKYVIPERQCLTGAPPQLKVPAADWKVAWREFMSDARVRDKPVDVWLYPTREESLRPELMRVRLESVAMQLRMEGLSDKLVLHSLARDSRWPRMTYIDAIHPDAAGVGLLAEIMATPSPATLVP